MRNLVGVIATTLVILLVLPSASLGETPQSRKYAVELQIGGGYSLMGDVNDFVAHAQFTGAGITPETEINLGAQFGVALIYRNMDNFAWQIGYNRFAFIQNYRLSAYFTSQESWAEQSIKGAEFYTLATWYKPMGSNELFFGVGPGIYFAGMDRSIDIVLEGNSHLTDGGFSNAKGKSFGILGTIGYEMMYGDNTSLTFQIGARSAVVDKLKYHDGSGNEQVVWLDPYLVGLSTDADDPKLTVDYSGVFAKITLRAYFEPSSSWRTPKR